MDILPISLIRDFMGFRSNFGHMETGLVKPYEWLGRKFVFVVVDVWFLILFIWLQGKLLCVYMQLSAAVYAMWIDVLCF